MTIENDFLTFAGGSGANVLTQSAYAALTDALANGFRSGVAQSAQMNKVWRQSSIMAAVLAAFIVDQSGQPAIDDGTTATLEANFIAGIRNVAKTQTILTDTGSANAYAAANTPALTALPTSSGLMQRVSIVNANTGASTYAPDSLTAKPIYGLNLTALQGGELPAKGVAVMMYVVATTVNSGNGAWVLIECTGGALQVPNATQPQHAVALGQATGRLLNIQIFNSSGTYTPTAGTTSIVVEAIGGGAAGGGAPATSSNVSVGGGGGAGAFVRARFPTVSSQTVTIGAGGVGVTGAAGQPGGVTTFGSLVTAGGGIGGAVAGPATAPTAAGGGAGSSTFSATGVYIGSAGAPGAIGIVMSAAGAAISGAGGASQLGGGPVGQPTGVTGVSATTPGAGGTGTVNNTTGAALAGGSGHAGVVIVYEYGTGATVA